MEFISVSKLSRVQSFFCMRTFLYKNISLKNDENLRTC